MARIEINVPPYEYLNECNAREIEETIRWLTSNGYIEKKEYHDFGYLDSYEKSDFDKKLGALSNSYHSLTVEEEDVILNIAKKFI